MIKRYSVALIGASAVTFALILGMSEVAKWFERPDSQVYMRVMDFIPGAGGRRLPDKRMPEAQPERAQLEAGAVATELPDDMAPAVEIDQDTAEIDVRVDLDTPTGD